MTRPDPPAKDLPRKFRRTSHAVAVTGTIRVLVPNSFTIYLAMFDFVFVFFPLAVVKSFSFDFILFPHALTEGGPGRENTETVTIAIETDTIAIEKRDRESK